MFWFGLALGLFLGGTIGIFIGAACAAADHADAHIERICKGGMVPYDH